MMRSRRRYLEKLARASVIAHTIDGRSIAGVLQGVYRDVLVLAPARMLVDSGDPVELDGAVTVERARVSFLQVERPS